MSVTSSRRSWEMVSLVAMQTEKFDSSAIIQWLTICLEFKKQKRGLRRKADKKVMKKRFFSFCIFHQVVTDRWRIGKKPTKKTRALRKTIRS